jgi:hypothetical protein
MSNGGRATGLSTRTDGLARHTGTEIVHVIWETYKPQNTQGV